MRRRWILLILATCIAGTLVFLVKRPRGEGPVYNDHSLYHWLDIAIKTNTPLAAPEDVVVAYRAVIHIVTNGIPWLLMQLKRSPNPWEYKLGERISNLGSPWNVRISNLVLGDASYVSGLAVFGFEILGTNALFAIPELSRIANNTRSPGASQAASIALSHVGNDAIPILLSMMTNRNHPQRGLAARLVVDVTPRPDDTTLAAIRRLASDPDPSVAQSARQALSYLKTMADQKPPPTEPTQRGSSEGVTNPPSQ